MKLRLLPMVLAALFAMSACASVKREPKAPGRHDNHHHENHR
jgi:hypothetical protein